MGIFPQTDELWFNSIRTVSSVRGHYFLTETGINQEALCYLGGRPH